MAVTTSASRLGVSAFSDFSPVELRPGWSAEEAKVAIRAVYRQVLGNDYVMASERLVGAESLLSNGSISVRDFVRSVAKSELYREKFLYPNFQSRVIELNFKHLLGRAPVDEAEIVEHLDRYQNEGFDADIDSYIDSEEYLESFGDDIVPYYRGLATQRTQARVNLPHFFQLYRGYANSDRSQLGGGSPRLAVDLARNTASNVIAPSSDASKGFAYRSNIQSAVPSSALGGTTPYGRTKTRIYRIEVAGLVNQGYPRVRRSSRSFLVPFEQLFDKYRQISQQGGRIVSVTPA